MQTGWKRRKKNQGETGRRSEGVRRGGRRRGELGVRQKEGEGGALRAGRGLGVSNPIKAQHDTVCTKYIQALTDDKARAYTDESACAHA